MAKVQGRERLNGRRANTLDASLSSRTFARLAIAALVLGCAALGTRPALAQDDDWSVVPSQSQSEQVHQSHPSKANPAEADLGASQALPHEVQPGADGAQMICGEMARPAVEPYKSIVADIDRQWGTNAPVYESVRADSPHVSRAGCIFYNPTFMEVFLRGETDEHGEPDKTSMIYAIMAHELGHIEHHDLRAHGRAPASTRNSRPIASPATTLSRMGISRGNITPFYSLGGAFRTPQRVPRRSRPAKHSESRKSRRLTSARRVPRPPGNALARRLRVRGRHEHCRRTAAPCVSHDILQRSDR